MPSPLPPLHNPGVPGVSVYADQQRRRYRIQFYRKGERRITLTLQSTHPATAQREASELAALYDRGKDPATFRASPTLARRALASYLDDCHRRRLSAATMEQRRTVLGAWLQTLPEKQKLHALTLGHCRTFYDAPRLAPETRKTYYNLLSGFLNWCVRGHLLERSPLKDVPRPKGRKGLPDYYTPEQFRALLQTIRGDLLGKGARLTGPARLVLDLPEIVQLAAETGLRQGELLHLRWIDVDFSAGYVHVRAYKDEQRGIDWKPKDEDARAVPLSPEATDLLRRRRDTLPADPYALVFAGRGGRVRCGKRLTRTLKQYVRKAGLPDQLDFHSLRHSFASWHISGGTPLEIVQGWMGHQDFRMTKVYAQLLPSALAWRENVYHQAARRP